MLVAGGLALAGCGTQTYAPPLQRPAEAMSRGGLKPLMIGMADPESAAYIAGGMRDVVEGAGWRWTHERAELRFPLPRPDGWRFRLDFTLPEANLNRTGPVTVSVWIDAKLLDKTRYEAPGDHWMEKPVPPEWLGLQPVNVAIEVDPPWVDPGPAGEKLGLVLSRVGFLR
jgi:hypothetical protein